MKLRVAVVTALIVSIGVLASHARYAASSVGVPMAKASAPAPGAKPDVDLPRPFLAERGAVLAGNPTTPAEEPVTAFLERGQRLFLANGCGACHTIRGIQANGILGPDLTHIGGRVSIGAGLLPNHVGTLAGWISSAQHLKPEILMPSFGNLEGEELRSIAAYLESLK